MQVAAFCTLSAAGCLYINAVYTGGEQAEKVQSSLMMVKIDAAVMRLHTSAPSSAHCSNRCKLAIPCQKPNTPVQRLMCCSMLIEAAACGVLQHGKATMMQLTANSA
jgi:hypothetical protein